MRLVRCGLFVLAFVVGTQLFYVSLWCSSYFPVATMFSVTLCLAALITWGRIKARRLSGFGRASRHCRMVGHDCRVSV